MRIKVDLLLPPRIKWPQTMRSYFNINRLSISSNSLRYYYINITTTHSRIHTRTHMHI